ncbi:MAG: glycosyltransferase family 2 protein [Thermodesulfobacteriota bacterium]
MQSNLPSPVDVSVVVPVYNSSSLLPQLYDRLCPVLDSLSAHWELILVDDASRDESFPVMQKLRAHDKRVRVIQLARNHGQQHATLCGLNYARGLYTITLDDDLQCQPEDLSKFVVCLREGAHVVIGRISKGEKKHRWWRNLGSIMNQYLAGRILGKPKDLYLSSYRGFSRYTVDKMIAYKGAHPHIAALFLKAMPSRYIINVDVAHEPRADGRPSTYTLAKLIKTASYLLINHSYLPLRVMVGWGVILSIASLCFAFLVALGALFFGYTVAGWASLIVLLAFFSGNILLSLGIVGEYLGRLVEEASTVEQFTVFKEDV